MSRVDMRITQGYLEVDLDRDHKLPKTMKLVILTGVKGDGMDAGKNKRKRRDLGNEEHVAFTFAYDLSGWSDVEPIVLPRGVNKILK